METVMKADIFFVVTTVAVALVAVAMLIALVYIIRILRDVTYISKKVKEESDGIISDVRELRASIKSQGVKIGPLAAFLGKLLHRRSAARRKTPVHESRE
jgi:hypothetical protein